VLLYQFVKPAIHATKQLVKEILSKNLRKFDPWFGANDWSGSL